MGDMAYQQGGTPELIAAIGRIHNEFGNCEMEGRHVVVANGATQAICAALYAYSRRFWKNVEIQSPHWFRLPEIVSIMNMRWAHGGGIQLITRPNNPDSNNDPLDPMIPNAIVDCCYNWPQYTDNVRKVDQEIAIFGLAKMTGHASLRVGWAVVKDKEMADYMNHYVERTTSGISMAAQMAALEILRDELAWADSTAMGRPGGSIHWATEELKLRWKRLQAVMPEFISIENREKSGMFAWCKMKVEECGWSASWFMEDRYQVKVMSGLASGSTFEYFRLNMGCSSDEFDELLERLRDRSVRP